MASNDLDVIAQLVPEWDVPAPLLDDDWLMSVWTSSKRSMLTWDAHVSAPAGLVFVAYPGGSAPDPGQDWFWTDRWQSMEREADDDIAAGRVAAFDGVDQFLADLDS